MLHFSALVERPQVSDSLMDVDAQRRIAEEIKQTNIDENMTLAMEEHPESFVNVVMLWINMKVNGHQVKGERFVFSGIFILLSRETDQSAITSSLTSCQPSVYPVKM